MKEFRVYLYRAPECRRGWLAYLGAEHAARATLTVKAEAESGARAKNKAITSANNDFTGIEIIGRNYDDPLWGINNFPDLHFGG